MTVSKGSQELAGIRIVPGHVVVEADDFDRTRRQAIAIGLAVTLNALIFLALFFRLDFQQPRIEPRTIPIELVHEVPKPQPQPQPQPQPKPEDQKKPEEQKKPEPEKKTESEKKEQASRQQKPLIAGKANQPEGPERAKARGNPSNSQEKPQADSKPKPEPVETPSWATNITQGLDLSNIPDLKKRVSPNSSAFAQGSGGGGGNEYLLNMQLRVYHNLKYPAEAGGRSGQVIYEVRVRRDGMLLGLAMRKSSGSPDLDRAAEEAIRRSAPFAPLTSDFAYDEAAITAPILVEP